MDQELKVREATIDDLSLLLKFTLALAKIIGTQVNQFVLRRGIRRFFEEQDESYGKYFILMHEGVPVGQVVIKSVLFESWQNARVVWIDDFHVIPPYDTSVHMRDVLQECIGLGAERQPQEIIRLYCPNAHPRMLGALSLLGFGSKGYFMQQSQDYILKPPRDSGCEIREATIEDANIITRFTMHLAKTLLQDVNFGTLQDGIMQFLQNPRYGKCFLAIAGGEVVGQLSIKKCLLEPWYDSKIIWLDDAFVHPDCRNTGAMKVLLHHGIEWAVAGEYAGIVQLYCPFKNSPGVAYWTNVGFETIGYMMERQQDINCEI